MLDCRHARPPTHHARTPFARLRRRRVSHGGAARLARTLLGFAGAPRHHPARYVSYPAPPCPHGAQRQIYGYERFLFCGSDARLLPNRRPIASRRGSTTRYFICIRRFTRAAMRIRSSAGETANSPAGSMAYRWARRFSARACSATNATRARSPSSISPQS